MLPAGFRGGLFIIYWHMLINTPQHIQSVRQIKNWYCLWPSDTEYASSGMAVFIGLLIRGVSAKPEDILRGIRPDWTCHLLYLDSMVTLNAHSYVLSVFEIACIFHIKDVWNNCATCKRRLHSCLLLLIPCKSAQYTFTGSSCLWCLLRLAENVHVWTTSRIKYHLIYLHESLILTGFDSTETSLFLIVSRE